MLEEKEEEEVLADEEDFGERQRYFFYYIVMFDQVGLRGLLGWGTDAESTSAFVA